MARLITKIGYCPDCRKNIHHVHAYKSLPARVADGCLLGLVPRVLRLGSWHCRVCNRMSTLLAFRRWGALDYDRPGLDPSPATAGNYINREKSLVLRSERNNRYTKKFRQSVVERILSATVTLIEMREELNVSEADLLTWIGEVVDSQAEMINQLNRMVGVLVENTPQFARLHADVELVLSERDGGEKQ